MDPDTTLEQLQAAIRRWHRAVQDETVQAERDAASEAIEAMTGLDAWMRKGGRPPVAWQAGSNGSPALPLI